MNGNPKRFGRTRNVIATVRERRTKTIKKRNPRDSKRNARRPGRAQRNKRVQNNLSSRGNRAPPVSPNYRSHLNFQHSGGVKHVSLGRMNSLSSTVPVRKNFEFEGRFPDIRPPEASIGRTNFGDCLVVAGTESFLPVTVATSEADSPTAVGSILASLEVNPTLLASTRLKKLSENYEKWYPRKLILEFVPQGSALDSGALISIPVMDPADTFIGSSGNDAIRRALAYDKSFAFNVYDKPQILLPPAELDEPYFVIPGSDARLEISHQWFLMAQTGFEARTTQETYRVVGWFKLHYVVEFYEPRIPAIEDPEFKNILLSDSAVLSIFGAERAPGDEFIGSVSLLYSNPPCAYIKLTLGTDWTVEDTDPTSVIEVTDGSRDISLYGGTILYMRLTHDYTPIFRFYSNVNDMFEQSNPLVWVTDCSTSATTKTSVRAVAVCMWN